MTIRLWAHEVLSLRQRAGGGVRGVGALPAQEGTCSAPNTASAPPALPPFVFPLIAEDLIKSYTMEPAPLWECFKNNCPWLAMFVPVAGNLTNLCSSFDKTVLIP